jgi:hypothetical protein
MCRQSWYVQLFRNHFKNNYTYQVKVHFKKRTDSADSEKGTYMPIIEEIFDFS